MKKVALLIIVVCFISCESSVSAIDNNILVGVFKEVTPVADRVEVSISGQSLTYIFTENGQGTSFTIKELPNNMLELSCNECDQSAPQVVSYKIIDIDTFEIGGFFLQEENALMTFTRVEAE